MPWQIWVKFRYQNLKTILRTMVPISTGVIWVKLKEFDTVFFFHLIDVLSKILHGCIRNTQPRLGSVPSPSSHCCVGHSFGGRGLSNGAWRICSACTVYSFGGGVSIVVLADSRHQVLPGQPVPSLFKLRQGVWRCKNLNGCLRDLFCYIF